MSLNVRHNVPDSLLLEQPEINEENHTSTSSMPESGLLAAQSGVGDLNLEDESQEDDLEQEVSIVPEARYPNSKMIPLNQLIRFSTGVCKVWMGSGFFGEFEFEEETFCGLFTCNHVLNESILRPDERRIALNFDLPQATVTDRPLSFTLKDLFRFTSEKLDLSFIEVNKSVIDGVVTKNPQFHFLHVAANGLCSGDCDLYIVHFPYGGSTKYISSGEYKGACPDQEFRFKHLVSTDEGSSGSPVINPLTGEVIGMHCGSSSHNDHNIGVTARGMINAIIESMRREKHAKKLCM